MTPELGAPTAQMQHEMCPGVHRRELTHHDLPPDAQHGEFPVLVHQGVVGKNRKIDERTQLTRMEMITSPCLIVFTTSIPLVTCPNTVCTPSR